MMSDVSQLWRHQAIKKVSYIWLWSIHSCFQWYKNYKNAPRDARVIVENKVAPFSRHDVVWESVKRVLYKQIYGGKSIIVRGNDRWQ